MINAPSSHAVIKPELNTQGRSISLWVLRGGAFVLMIAVALLLVIQQSNAPNTGQSPAMGLAINYWQPISIAIAFFCLMLTIDLLTPNKKIATISGVFLGTLTGILLSVALATVFDLMLQSWAPDKVTLDAMRPIVRAVDVLLGIALVYLCISTVLQTQDQFRLVIPYVEFSKEIRGVRPNLLDTSALIDARIADVAATGVLQAPFVIPSFVIAELQSLSDSQDKLKRARGRRGLEIITRLQRQGTLDLTIDDTPTSAVAVDQALIELAERLGGRVVTTDLGLQRVAEIRGVQVLNLHDIANAFKPSLLPGEQIILRLVKPGEQAGQGVGYLDDGTMVVAEGGAEMVGAGPVGLLVTSTMQTTAGRLVFARLADSSRRDEPARAQVPDDADDQVRPAEETADAIPESGESTPTPASPAAAAPPARRQGPFPPKPPAARTGTPRNPRR